MATEPRPRATARGKQGHAVADRLAGRRLSHFRLMRRIGEGGMGVVYHARDIRLQRDVALKVLAPGRIASLESRHRFRREALAWSRLNHPAIATVYEFDADDGVDFLAMELIQGDTLAARLEKGPIPRIQALGICLQIAEALEVAHADGVIHRDLKPGNVMVTASGLVKVLDFGLARATARAPRATGPKGSRPRRPAAGVLRDSEAMGTPGYMSPEQAMGESQDHRTDIFAFGCVLFECLAGAFAFEGETSGDILGAVLTKEPRWEALPSGLPSSVKELLQRCLEKDPDRRLPAMGDARLVLEEVLGAGRRHTRARGSAPPSLPWSSWQGTTFVGREAELASCRRLLADARLLTLTGLGGCGKTRLALRLAEDLIGDYPDGVWFVDLAPHHEAERVAHAVAAAAGVREEADVSPLECLTKAAAEKTALVLLDNCEHQMGPCAEIVRALLPACPGVTVLATSREALPVSTGHSFAVPPLATPEVGEVVTARSLATIESVRLFLERASRVKPTFKLSDRNAPAVAEICRRLDGIPLAIELAASRLAVLSVEEIRAKLDRRFRLLGTEAPGTSSRHQTLHATIQWSYEQLTPEEQRLFRALSVFRGGWTFDAAAGVGSGDQDEFTVLDLFTRLLEKSLFVVGASEDGAPRYRYLETIREFAREQAEAAGEDGPLRSRHLDYFLALAEEAAPKLTGPEQGSWLIRLETEHENLLAALETCDSPERSTQGLRLTAAIRRFWVARGHFAVGRRAIDAALRRDVPRSTTVARGETLVGGSALAFHVNDWSKGSSQAEEAIEIFTALRDARGLADALVARGNHALGQADYDTARSLYGRGLSEYREAGERRGMGVALSNAGRAAELQGDLASAAGLYEEGLAILREVGDLSSTALRLSSLGHLLMKCGDLAAAKERLLECLILVYELREKRAGEFALERSAALLQAEGRSSEAAVICAAAEAMSERMGSPLTPRERRERDELIASLREALGAAFTAAWSEGRAVDFESAIGRASSALGSKAPSVRTSGTDAKKESTRRTASTAFLLEDIRAGDPEATARLVKRYLPLLRKWAHGLLPSRARQYSDTDDLVQVALIRGLRQAATFEHRRTGSFLAYMKQILRNQVRDEVRRPGARVEFVEPPEDLQGVGATPIEELMKKESLEQYEAALATLSEMDRDRIIMRLEMGLSYGEIAEVLGSPTEEAARVAVRRALERLRKRFPEMKTTGL